MADKVVTASIDANAKTVTLSPGTFTVVAGDNDEVRWDFSGVPEGSTARVKFVGFAKTPESSLTAPPAPLFKAGNLLEAEGGVIKGVVDDAGADDGQYTYVVELVSAAGGATELKHVSSDGSPKPKPAGQKSPGPGRDP